MILQGDSPLFSFDGKHCDEFGVAFLPSEYPFVPAQTIPSMTLNNRHGSQRWPGRTFRPRYYKGTLYFLNSTGDVEPISSGEMLRRASEIAAWLCGKDGRGHLILDALDDRYFVAELEGEAPLADADWQSGEAQISFLCQPFARSMLASTLSLDTQANTAKSGTLSVDGNYETVLAFSVTNDSGAAMNTLTIEAPETRFSFENLELDDGEILTASHTEDDILLLRIEGVDGAIRSAMAYRTTDSDDDLLLSPGRNQVTVKTERACSVKLSALGRWL